MEITVMNGAGNDFVVLDARGKEMDPWDRPDIDIRKYQRKE